MSINLWKTESQLTENRFIKIRFPFIFTAARYATVSLLTTAAFVEQKK